MAVSSPATATQPIERPVAEAASNTVPRKRRRRAPATGATEDCFACRKRHVKCDRRRPYCSQCIEMGKECSGYRTTLTWGVGVASRGKLRGMSLPVPRAVPSKSSNNVNEFKAAAAATSASSASRKPATSSLAVPPSGPIRRKTESDVRIQSTSLEVPPLPQEPLSAGGATSPIPIPIPMQSPVHQQHPWMGWQMPSFGEPFEHHFAGYFSKNPRNTVHPRPAPAPLQRIQTSLATSYDEAGFSAASTGSISGYSDSDFPSPTEFPQTPDDYSFMEPGIPAFHQLYMEPPHTPMGSLGDALTFLDVPRSYPTADEMSSSIGSEHGSHDYLEVNPLHSHFGPGSFGDFSFDPEVSTTGDQSTELLPTPVPGQFQPLATVPAEPSPPLSTSHDAAGANVHQQHQTDMSAALIATSGNLPGDGAAAGASPDAQAAFSVVPRSIFASSGAFCLSPRMQVLLDYYDKAICPVLVAFDGPTNPYRMHIMHLAVESEGLQNAIAALATNNMRMRGGTEARRLCYSGGGCVSGESPLPDHAYSEVTAQELREMHGEPTPEESRYKAASIAQLNAQLADPSRACDDSVLATLLILCLFHVCDSGFAKFRTQLAGVQKLLSMRDRQRRRAGGVGGGGNFVGWVEMFFTWFDVMTSCVNDREVQIRGESLDMPDLSANLGALEHLSGCEGRLFKLIARLGRLNLLSQNRPVRDPDDRPTPRPSSPATAAPPTAAVGPPSKDYYSVSYDRLTGAGGSVVSEMADEVAWSARLIDSLSSSPPAAASPGASAGTGADTRHEFWTEWADVRTRLQGWSIEFPHADYSPPGAREMAHMSESFRYAALLYTERLASPQLPSSDPSLQRLVRATLHHISQIGIASCMNKFLLWPLFIAGAECVEGTHRATVRQRCVEIQRESGFFNNLSGLEVLERTWREPEDEVGTGCGAQQAFKWRRAMDRMDGEYIVL